MAVCPAKAMQPRPHGSGSSLMVPSCDRDRAAACPRRPTLLGSPMRTPSASPSSGPTSWPRNVPDMPSMTLDDDETAALQAAIEASLGEDMKRRLQSSLQSTEMELIQEYSDEVRGPSRDLKRARLRSSSDLEEVVATAARRPSPSPPFRPAPSPKLGAQALPEDDDTLSPHDLFPAIEERESEASASPEAQRMRAPECEASGDNEMDTQPCEPVTIEVQPPPPLVTPPAPYEFEGLLDHELLLESIYAAQGLDLRAQQEKATAILNDVGLRPLDLGVKNWDEEGREIVNQCFYLSIARSYLGPFVEAEEVQRAALLLKRTVEACVLAAHPEWATDNQRLGENAMAFADFLPVAMGAKDPPNLVARLAVLIWDTTQGTAEVYLGPLYAKENPDSEERAREELEKNLVLLCYTPGHYKALVQNDDWGSKPAWTYSELKGMLDEKGVMCIETSDFD